MRLFRKKVRHIRQIDPDEIFLDSTNLPAHEINSFEGRVTRPVSHRALLGVGIVFTLIACTFSFRAFDLQVAHGATYADISQNNTLDKSLVFATRGIIYDRTGAELAWNVPQVTDATSTASTTPYALRRYTELPGLADLLGFVQYPQADKSGVWWRQNYAGMAGAELSFDSTLSGVNGSTMTETNAHGTVERQNIIAPPQDGQDITLSINADIQSALFKAIVAHAQTQGFQGGAGIIMDVRTGQIIALTSFPEYNDQALTDGDNAAFTADSQNPLKPFLDRAISGLYAPGSIMKTIFAAGALNEGIITPEKEIDSVGEITIPNPYDPKDPSVFHDWTAHGWIDMRTALAVSSDEYFYTIGGGYGDQPGLGITRLDKYGAMFGLGSTTGIALLGEQAGVIPTPAWKAVQFPNDPTWRLGDTYHTAIGQYGWQVTPIQVVRYIAAIANGGKLYTPQIIASTTPQFTTVDIPDADLEVVREGMRLAVTSNRSDATVDVLNIPGIDIAAKTGTAQIGAHNQWVNSWAVGFWPANDPHYAFAVVSEQGPASETAGSAPGLAPFFEWLIQTHPEYLN